MTKTYSPLALFFLVLLTIIWGSSFILMKKSLVAFEPIQVASMRIFIAGMAFLPVVITQFKKLPKHYLKPLLFVGLFGNAIPAILFTTAQTQVSSATSGALNALTPVFTLVLGILFFKNKINKWQQIGVFIGLVGGLILVFSKNSINHGETNFWYAMLIVLATLCYGISVNINHNYLKELSPLVSVAFSIFMVALPYGFIMMYYNPLPQIQGPSGTTSFICVLTLALLGSALSSIIFFKLIQMTNAVFASSVTYLMPAIALFLGLYDGEFFGFWQVLGLVIVLLGIYFVNKKS